VKDSLYGLCPSSPDEFAQFAKENPLAAEKKEDGENLLSTLFLLWHREIFEAGL
jgi:hypothetical protein